MYGFIFVLDSYNTSHQEFTSLLLFGCRNGKGVLVWWKTAKDRVEGHQCSWHGRWECICWVESGKFWSFVNTRVLGICEVWWAFSKVTHMRIWSTTSECGRCNMLFWMSVWYVLWRSDKCCGNNMGCFCIQQNIGIYEQFWLAGTWSGLSGDIYVTLFRIKSSDVRWAIFLWLHWGEGEVI